MKANKMFALAITALILIIPAFTFPLLSIYLLGITEDINLLQGALMMIERAPIVSFVVLFCAVVIPTLLTLCIAFSSGSIMLGKRPRLLAYVLKLTSSLMHWSMLDVYLISLLVSAIKITSDADVQFGSGLYFFVVLLIVNLTLMSEYSSTKYWKYLRNE
jgi:paraquat-inducible protein A